MQKNYISLVYYLGELFFLIEKIVFCLFIQIKITLYLKNLISFVKTDQKYGIIAQFYSCRKQFVKNIKILKKTDLYIKRLR